MSLNLRREIYFIQKEVKNVFTSQEINGDEN